MTDGLKHGIQGSHSPPWQCTYSLSFACVWMRG